MIEGIRILWDVSLWMALRMNYLYSYSASDDVMMTKVRVMFPTVVTTVSSMLTIM